MRRAPAAVGTIPWAASSHAHTLSYPSNPNDETLCVCRVGGVGNTGSGNPPWNENVNSDMFKNLHVYKLRSCTGLCMDMLPVGQTPWAE